MLVAQPTLFLHQPLACGRYVDVAYCVYRNALPAADSSGLVCGFTIGWFT